MKILVDVRLLGRGGSSGIEEYTRELVTHLLTLDQENHYQLFYNGFLKKVPLELPGRRAKTEIIDWHLPNKILDFTNRSFHFPAIDKATGTDLVFSPHFNILSTTYAPRIITFHDLSFVHHPEFFGARQRFWHWLQNFRRQAAEATNIIANSEFTKYDIASQLQVPTKKIVTIYEGVRTDLRPLPRDDAGLKNFKQAHQISFPYLLYLGTLEPRKNIRGVIRAFNLLQKNPINQDIRLILAGRPGWLYQDILRERDRSPHRSKIILWGQVREEEKIFLYNAASAFVYPSFFEGFGLPPLEAQACGIPVVASNRTSLPEVVGDAGLLIDPWRIDELVEALQNILHTNKTRENLIRAGLENSLRFSWTDAAKKTLDLFHEANLNRHHSSKKIAAP